METTFLNKKTTRWGASFCALGLALAALALYVSDVEKPPGRTIASVSLDLVLFGATTLLSLGLVSMILDTEGWRDYFERGLTNIVQRPGFLKTLKPEQLTEYQIEVFKKYYDREDIDQEGRFLRYCLGHIHKYIVEPYREEIRAELRVDADSPERLRISETLSYICRVGKVGIQERLVWGMNEETLAVESLRFELQVPPEVLVPQALPDKRVWTQGELQTETAGEKNGLPEFVLDLKPFQQVDRLGVTIHATYFVDRSRFNTWRMIVPSRHVDVSIVYPRDLRLQFIPFLLDTTPDHRTDDAGFYSVEFRSWIMPWSGFAWKLLPGEPAQEQAVLPAKAEAAGASAASRPN